MTDQAQAVESEAIEVTDVESAARAIEARWTQQEEAEAAEPQEVAEAEEASDEAEEVDEVETDEEADELEESEEQEPEADDSETPAEFETVDDIAEAMGVTTEELLSSIKMPRKIDGVEEMVTLAEMRNGNQRDADYRKKTTELADNRRNFEAEVNQAKENLAQQFKEAAQMTAILEEQLLSDFQGIDWNALEYEDREEWLVKRQKFVERQQQIQAIKAQASQKLTEQQQEQQRKQQESYNQMLAEQNERLLMAIPEWSDNSVRESEAKEMANFLGEYGFNEEEVGSVIDHRLVMLARDAMKNKGKSQQVETVKKKVKKLPKLLKPAAIPDKKVVQRKKNDDKLKAFRQKDRHTNQDLAAMLIDRV